MSLPVVENLSGLQDSIFSLSSSPQLHFGKKSKNDRIILNLSIFLCSPCLGSLGLLSSVWGLLLGSYLGSAFCSAGVTILFDDSRRLIDFVCRLQTWTLGVVNGGNLGLMGEARAVQYCGHWGLLK